ncbi:MAG: cupin domain-containing protein [Candidatus Sumerlaeota bacterium]|nr:cupin domain-containing protein [Candidatus Sumerlaeota bacterium]
MSENAAGARVTRMAQTQPIVEDWGAIRWVAGRALGNAESVTVGLVTIRRGRSNPRHSHPNSEEVLHLLQGRLEHTFGAERAILEPGDTIVIAPGAPHNARSIGDQDAEMVVAYPTGDRRFHREDAP